MVRECIPIKKQISESAFNNFDDYIYASRNAFTRNAYVILANAEHRKILLAVKDKSPNKRVRDSYLVNAHKEIHGK